MANICTNFHNNPTINPRTGRKIIIGGSTYNNLVKECGPPPVLPTVTTLLPMKGTVFPLPITPRIQALPVTPPQIKVPTIIPQIKPITIQPIIIPQIKPTIIPQIKPTIIPQIKPTMIQLTVIPQIRPTTIQPTIPQVLGRFVSPKKINNLLEITDAIRGIVGIAENASNIEDRYQVKQIGRYRYFAIFNGHGPGGERSEEKPEEHVVDYVADHLHEHLVKSLKDIDLDNYQNVMEAIRNAFIDLDGTMNTIERFFGSTCTAILIDDVMNIIYQINLGNSHSVIFNTEVIISNSEERKVMDPEEKARIEAAGETVIFGKINNTFLPPRAFGDFGYKRDKGRVYDPINGAISVIPDITVISIVRPMFILLTSTDRRTRESAISDRILIEDFNKLYAQARTPNQKDIENLAVDFVEEIADISYEDVTAIIIVV